MTRVDQDPLWAAEDAESVARIEASHLRSQHWIIVCSIKNHPEFGLELGQVLNSVA